MLKIDRRNENVNLNEQYKVLKQEIGDIDKLLCDLYTKKLGIDQMIKNNTFLMGKYGFDLNENTVDLKKRIPGITEEICNLYMERRDLNRKKIDLEYLIQINSFLGEV